MGDALTEDERAFAFIINRARYYARNGTTTCGTCGASPPAEKDGPFSEAMPCGHRWDGLMWTPNQGALRT